MRHSQHRGTCFSLPTQHSSRASEGPSVRQRLHCPDRLLAKPNKTRWSLRLSLKRARAGAEPALAAPVTWPRTRLLNNAGFRGRHRLASFARSTASRGVFGDAPPRSNGRIASLNLPFSPVFQKRRRGCQARFVGRHRPNRAACQSHG